MIKTKTSRNYNKFNFSSLPHPDIRDLISKKFTIRSFEISSHGKVGVFFVETQFGSVAVKCNNEGPQDMFFNLMAEMVGLRVPDCEIYLPYELEFKKIAFEIEKYCQKDEPLLQRLLTRLDQPYYHLQEYIPHLTFSDIGPARFQKYLTEEPRLYELGKCLGFDMLVNNSDRMQLLWSSNGNLANILIEVKDAQKYSMEELKDRNNQEVELGEYVFIDHGGHLLDLDNPMAKKNFQIYMEKVTQFLIMLVKSLSPEESQMPPQFSKLSNQIHLYTNYTLSQSELLKVSEGIVYSISQFLNLFNKKKLDDLYEDIVKDEIVKGEKGQRKKETCYWNQYWNEQLSKIRLGYLEQVHHKVNAVFVTYPETIKHIRNNVQKYGTAKQIQSLSNVGSQQQIKQIKSEEQKRMLYDEENEVTQKASIKNEEEDEDQDEEKYEREEQEEGPSEEEKKKSNNHMAKALKQRFWRLKLQKFKEKNYQ